MQMKIDRKLFWVWMLLTLSIVIYLPTIAISTQLTPKKLIEYGWGAPTPNFVRQHLKEMEQRPFDGVILKLNAGKEVFKKTAYPDAAFKQDRRDLAAIRPSRLTDNFVVMWSGMDDDWDWFNDIDWGAAEQNIQNFAKTAKAGRLRGIAFDSEPYTKKSPWQYQDRPTQHRDKTFAAYQRQVRKRGAQFMTTLQTAQPGTQVLTLALLSWLKDLWAKPLTPAQVQEQLAAHKYGLWPAFINGMLDVAKSNSVIIDGNEWAYYFYRVNFFDESRDLVFNKARLLVDPKNDRKYAKQVKLAQAVYLDLTLHHFPTGSKDFRYGKAMPYFLSPDDRLRFLENNVYHALRTTDRYAWFYSEGTDWWLNKIPNGAEAAIRRGKTKQLSRKPLGFDIYPEVEKALQQCYAVSNIC
ncbi:hypothetical protein [Chamaesiphon polymorphus]|uniref:Uncharacterized protein n=1 Tax=Chamaesiphon polymorphus CCALA 037 TaxID=2107692 RepID=A0A2T1GJX0_9CYAN|nr:hypothetical protein [Chamaesiphon polymorphus]PSB58075.1 hypothetical protein C7B77_06110 [Chamaesiphon polymorphus CCALA 037]